MGKSSLAKVVVNFIQERVKFDGGCIYVDAVNISSHKKFEKRLEEIIKYDKSKAFIKSESKNLKELLREMFDKKHKFLFLFDNIDSLIYEKTERSDFLKTM
jgi:hypothetical protein